MVFFLSWGIQTLLQKYNFYNSFSLTEYLRYIIASHMSLNRYNLFFSTTAKWFHMDVDIWVYCVVDNLSIWICVIISL